MNEIWPQLWEEIPKTFRVVVIVTIILLIPVSLAVGYWQNPLMGIQTAITGFFSVTLFGSYVVWSGRVMLSAKNMMQDSKDKAEIASNAAMRIQIGSMVKFLVLSAVLILLIVAFDFDVIAAIIGVSVIYVPIAVVPLFFKSEPAEAGDSCPESQPEVSKVEE